ncbi:FMN-dependent NADH-azoreductase [Photobacterium aphoticum]|uniref:FMN dependent NADH:quinone oxidoreductase n=2 Tax=Photobacterium aphoticum TaxID=754436 RepID=A0A0J1JFH9_9GAMM|nr:FMN-dependent NADH-azoreductase [Photobacterium aphoticum]KLV00472.1 FMN-dependent NADH-azoreductase [Photobacterium aphoticum]PSU59822.1 FMN-dependent NADH-azoreductase [Photobacterium aphoticum]GHA42035.1 FMN-dependent NADH-azoreductase [Photobacterium aphoticum]
MANVLVLKSSILGDYSQSNGLIDHLVNSLDTTSVIERDLASTPIPVLDGEIAGGLRGGDNLTQKQQDALTLSNQLIDEIQASDTLVIGAPMYNFSIPTQLKNWFDFIARAGVTFSYTENGPVGMLTGKKVIVVTTRGGMHKDGATDTMVPYLKTILGFVGMTDVQFVYAEALNMGEEMASKGLENAKADIAELAK